MFRMASLALARFGKNQCVVAKWRRSSGREADVAASIDKGDMPRSQDAVVKRSEVGSACEAAEIVVVLGEDCVAVNQST